MSDGITDAYKNVVGLMYDPAQATPYTQQLWAEIHRREQVIAALQAEREGLREAIWLEAGKQWREFRYNPFRPPLDTYEDYCKRRAAGKSHMEALREL